jgi:hypothetical protein
MRLFMLKHSSAVAASHNGDKAAAALQPSGGVLEDKRRYQAWMRGRRTGIECGREMLTAAVFNQVWSPTGERIGSNHSHQQFRKQD